MKIQEIPMFLVISISVVILFAACLNRDIKQEDQIVDRLSGKIAFITYDRERDNNHIYILHLDNGELLDITPSDIVDITNPIWSPDGKKIAFEGYFQDMNSIFILNEDGSNLLQITKDSNSYFPSWSPDGNYILFVSTDSDIVDSSGKRVQTIFKKTVNGKEMQHLEINDRQIDIPIIGYYRTDGLISVSESVTRHSFSNYVVDFDGTFISDIDKFNSTAIPKWSPTNKFVIFTTFQSNCSGIFIKSLSDDMKCIPIVSENNEIVHVKTATWSPNGKYILFTSDFGNSEKFDNLFIINTDGSGMKQITDFSFGASNATWYDD